LSRLRRIGATDLRAAIDADQDAYLRTHEVQSDEPIQKNTVRPTAVVMNRWKSVRIHKASGDHVLG
jgi:hypothetical protein